MQHLSFHSVALFSMAELSSYSRQLFGENFSETAGAKFLYKPDAIPGAQPSASV